MKFDYTIKNFRAFDSKGATFTISPITILTGTNSSGKSSMVKSMLLLNNYLTELKIAANRGQLNPAMIPMDFSDKEALVGDFANSLHVKVHNDAESQVITFSYKVFSQLLDQNASVELVFSEKENDEGGSGWLSQLSLSSEDTTFSLIVEFIAGRPFIRKYNRLGARTAFLRSLFFMSKEKDKKVFRRTAFDSSLMPSIATISSCLKKRSVFCLSALDVLSQFSPEEAHAMLWNHYEDENWKKAIELLWEDYQGYGELSFIDYFKAKEAFWLKEFHPINDPAEMRAEGDLLKLLKTKSFIPRLRWDDDNLVLNQFSFPLLIQILREFEQTDRNIYSDSCSFFLDFCSDIVEDVLFSPFWGYVSYISSSRAVVKRLYTMNDLGSSFDRLIRRIFVLKANIPVHAHYKPYSFINYGLRLLEVVGSDPVEGFGLEALEAGIGIKPFITFKRHNVLTSRPLSDLGYGITQLVSILLSIEVMILEQLIAQRVGEPCIIMVEEPEIHLHPRLQSLLADLFWEAYAQYNIHFIIETHSEYLIRKYQYLVAGHSVDESVGVDASDISIYYIYNADPAKRPLGQKQVQEIRIKPDGILDTPFGNGFFDEADNTSSKIWNLKFRSHAE